MTLVLTQLLPLLVFIVVDAFVTDARWSIASAIVFAVGQLAFTWAKQRRFEWFIVLDVALIAGLGGISIAFDDEVFFKVKPAIIEAVGLVLLVGLLLAPERFLLAYLSRMTPGQELKAEAAAAMRSTLALLCGGTVVHIALVLYTAFRSSRPVWAFVSGPGFYVLVVPLMFGVPLARRLRRGRLQPRRRPPSQ
jgi:intracellular septation protein A